MNKKVNELLVFAAEVEKRYAIPPPPMESSKSNVEAPTSFMMSDITSVLHDLEEASQWVIEVSDSLDPTKDSVARGKLHWIHKRIESVLWSLKYYERNTSK